MAAQQYDLPPDEILRFWEHMVARHPAEREHAPLTKEGGRWHTHRDRGLVVSLSVGARFARVGIRGSRGSKLDDARKLLEPRTAELEAALGPSIDDRDEDRLFLDRLGLDLTDGSNWDHAADWLYLRGQAYDFAIRQLFGAEG